jgi:lipopolysaccharide/colanic/teichoic acid biosynthesis glycosyltransferase
LENEVGRGPNADRRRDLTPRLSLPPEVLRVACYSLLLLCDVTAIHSAFAIAGIVRGDSWLQPSGYPVKWLMILCYVMIVLNGEAATRRAFRSRRTAIVLAERAVLWASAMTIMIIFFSQFGLMLSRLALATAILLSALLVAVGRFILLTLFVFQRSDLWERHVLINDGGANFPEFQGDKVNAAAANLTPTLTDPTMVERLGDYASRYDVITISCPDAERRATWATMLKFYDVHGEILLDQGRPIGAIGIGRVDKYDTLIVTRGTLSLANRIQKRLFDLVISAAALLLLAPFLLVIAIAIRLDSPGPVLFRQPRVGYQNRIFRIFKFRSMLAAESDLSGTRSTSPRDNRLTRLGHLIRRTSIDEVPQLINVLLGDMSLVGPRPHALGSLVDDKLFWEIDSDYWQRHSLKPGMTGLAQVRGFRGATRERSDLVNRLGADIEYLDGWTLWRDVRILFGTVRVLFHPNAY